MDALKTFIQRLTRNSNPLTGLVTATIGMFIMFDIANFTDLQVGAILTFVGAVVLFMSAYITPVYDPRLPIGTMVNATTDGMPTGVVTEIVDAE